ncbi:MAG: hypothetical protein IPK82_27190 [Polyangiaceae bacterium]|nr:hypothetical protein [Polyangiaceae bacterium]
MLRSTMKAVVFASGVLCAATARATPQAGASSTAAGSSAQDPAQVLFDTGVADMEAGRLEKACPAIEASHRLAPMPGTLFTLAECEALRGRTATAMRYYSEYLALYRTFSIKKKLEQKDRADACGAQLKKLELLTPRLTLRLPADAPTDVVVKRDGEVVAELSMGTATPVDPGEHRIVTQLPDGTVIEETIRLTAAESKTVEVRIRKPATAPTASPVATTSASVVVAPNLLPWRLATGSAGIVAAIGLGVGIVAGLLALDDRQTLYQACGTNDVCDPKSRPIYNRMQALGAASTVGFVAAGVGMSVGVVLLVASPSAPTASPPVGTARSSGATSAPFGLFVHGNF